MARVAQSIFGSQTGLLGSSKEERGAVNWYSLIDREARDSVCEQNSKKAPEMKRGCMDGGWEPELRREELSGVEAQSQKITLRVRD